MEPLEVVQVASDGCNSVSTSSVTVESECVEARNEQQAAVEAEKLGNQCQTKNTPPGIAAETKEKLKANDVRDSVDEMHRYSAKDENDISVQNSEKATVEELVGKDELPTAGEILEENETTSATNVMGNDETAAATVGLGQDKAATVAYVVQKNDSPTIGEVVKDETSTAGNIMGKNETPTVECALRKNETVTVGDALQKNDTTNVGEDIRDKETSTAEDIVEKDEAEGGGSPCSQEDMFASEPLSPGIIPCSIENTERSEEPEECAKDEKMEIDCTTEVLEDGRVLKRQHAEIDDCPGIENKSDAEGSLPKRARHSVEIVFECPKSQEPHDVPVTLSMNRSEELLDLTGGTEESVHLHYSPSPEYDIPETQFEPNLDPRAPSLATVVLGSDDDEDDDAEVTDKTVAAPPITQCAAPSLAANIGNEDTEEILVPKCSSPDKQQNCVTTTCTVVDSEASSNKQASEPRCLSSHEGNTSEAKDGESSSSSQHCSSPRQQKLAPDAAPLAQGRSLAKVPVHSSPYADSVPLPQYESLCNSVEQQTPLPRGQHSTSASKQPTSITENSDRILEMTKDIVVHMQAVFQYREESKEVICYELTQCDIIEEAIHSSTAETSNGTPVIDSKNTSPGSVTSIGPFPLAVRASTTSSSSVSSLSSAANMARSHASKRLRAGVPVLNLELVASAVRVVGPEPLPVPSAVFVGRKLRTVAPPATLNKTTDTAEDVIKEETEAKETVTTDVAVPSPATSVPDTEKRSTPRTTRKRGRARGGSSQNRPRARGQTRSQPSPQLSEPLTWGTEDASRFKGMLHPGASAFARWTDKRYYSAKLTEKQRDGRWLVAFDDGSAKTVKEDFVIPVETLTKGQLVYATLPDGSCADGIVSALFVQDNEEQYGVELDDGREVIVPRREIFLTEDQARLLLEGATVVLPAPSTPGRLADVDLNNLVTGKRIRTPTHSASGPPTPRTPGPSGNAGPNKVSRSSSPSDRESVTGPTTDDTVSIVGVEPESEGCKLVPVATGSSRGKGKVAAKGKGKALFATTNILQDSAELDEMLGPIPPKDSKLFQGMIFLLTSVDFELRKSYEKVHEVCSDSEGEREFSSYRFVKDRLRMQVEAGGGTVLESLDDVPEDRLRDTILIANRPCLTAKYICCLAKAVKIVNHDFIIERSKGETCTPNAFGLPLGWSFLDERYVGNAVELGAIQRTRKGGSRQLLARKKLVLVHETPQFLAFWQKVLFDLGAKTTTFSPNDAVKAEVELKSADAIVSDASCPPHIQERAREWRKPLISTTWITQCLINREVLPFDSLPNFSYDFCV